MAESRKTQKKRKIWSVRFETGNEPVDFAIRQIAMETGLSEITARLLWLRGYHTAAEAQSFFRMETTELHNPWLLQDMQKAVERIEQAVSCGEKIIIYGDYDVDGVTSVSLLFLYLRELGADVGYYIPNRAQEGYGVSCAAIDTLHRQGASLIITVDTGITANTEAEYAAGLGIDMIVTDHHECRAQLPRACAVVNPHRPDDAYPFKGLAGVGVVFKVVCAYEVAQCRKKGISESDGLWRVFRTYSDLAALGTIADVMPVTDENRLIVAMGLKRMGEDCRLGLRALMDAATVGKEKKKQVTSTYIGFTLAPRLNAAGRVSSASISAELLLSDTRQKADQLAQMLCNLNTERQAEENRIATDAYRKIAQMPEEERRYVLVLDDDCWHHGIIGIVSSRLTERYGLPSVLITYHGSMGEVPSDSDVGKGSGRSIKGLNLVDALASCEDLLTRYGGHEMAAGLSLPRGNVSEFRKRINEYAAMCLTEESLCGTVEADCEVEAGDLTLSLAREMDRLEPFGVSNPVPSFILRGAKVLRIIPMGNGKHTRLMLEKDGIPLQAVWFGIGPDDLPFEEGEIADLLFQININEFRNDVTLQLLIQDAALACSEEEKRSAEYQRYCEIADGAEFESSEQVLPDREDIVTVYVYLRREFRAGHTAFSIRQLMQNVRMPDGSQYSYLKMKFIIMILLELNICNASELVTDQFCFSSFNPEKTDLEKSGVLHRLRKQQKICAPQKER